MSLTTGFLFCFRLYLSLVECQNVYQTAAATPHSAEAVCTTENTTNMKRYLITAVVSAYVLGLVECSVPAPECQRGKRLEI